MRKRVLKMDVHETDMSLPVSYVLKRFAVSSNSTIRTEGKAELFVYYTGIVFRNERLILCEARLWRQWRSCLKEAGFDPDQKTRLVALANVDLLQLPSIGRGLAFLTPCLKSKTISPALINTIVFSLLQLKPMSPRSHTVVALGALV